METQLVIIFITVSVILSIMFFAYNNNKRCSREGIEGMEGSSPDQALQAALANGIVINTPDRSTTPGYPPGQSGNIVVKHDFGEKALAALERTNNLLTKIDFVNAEENLRSETATNDGEVDNYNYFKKDSLPLVYYGPGGSNAKLLTHGGKFAIVVIKTNGETMQFVDKETSYDGFFENANVPTANSKLPIIPKELSNISFYDNNGNVAKVYRAKNGRFIVQVDQANGMEVIYTPNNVYTYNTKNSKSFNIGKTVNNAATDLKTLENEEVDLENDIENNSIANGTPSSMIPPGDEDKYILKTQIVPPVCPRCPSICSADPKNQQPACPSCGNPGKSGSYKGNNQPQSNTGSYQGNNQPQSNTNADISPPNAYDAINNPTDKYSQYRHNSSFLPVPMVSDFSKF